ncbi:hypothetical protein [Ligilactobacillus ruminis]|jgi:hypothetical protein|uniref:hypothetical protein n=1 Tax=Ligilactobacillus ruminis TaxID=1623 RepID=UPI0022E88FEF|nr:hypothetical protein [Ligilactobacillus ruminis]
MSGIRAESAGGVDGVPVLICQNLYRCVDCNPAVRKLSSALDDLFANFQEL